MGNIVTASDDLLSKYDISCLRAFELCGSGSSVSFKQKMLERFPDTVVSGFDLFHIPLHKDWPFPLSC